MKTKFGYWDRRSYIGSGESGVVIGDCTKYKSKRRLWEEKYGRLEPKNLDEVLIVKAGLFNEPFILEDFEKTLSEEQRLVTMYDQTLRLPIHSPCKLVRTAHELVPDKEFGKLHLQHGKYPFVRCSPDAVVVDKRNQIKRVVDAKFVQDWDVCNLIASGRLPAYFRAQGRHFCKMLGLKQCDFHCWLIGLPGASTMRTLTYYDEPSGDISEPVQYVSGKVFFDKMAEFWQSVQEGDAPAADGKEMDDTPKIIRASMGECESLVEATQEQIDLAVSAYIAKTNKERYESEYRKLSLELSDSMGEGVKKLVVDRLGLVTRKKDGAMLYSKFVKESAARAAAKE